MAEYISRDDVLRKFIEGDGHDDERFTEGYNFAVQEHREEVKKIPAADVQPINQWISCKDEMPEDGISVLICSDRGTISKATYDSDMGYFYIADSELHYNELDITHWRHLPKPPKQ